MPQEKVYLSVDLGAGSSRIVAGIYNGEEIRLEEVARFPSTNVQVDDSYYWDFLGIYRNILDGLAQAIQRYGESIQSLGVDTWGVDYGLLDKDNRLIGNVYQYRDPRTDGIQEKIQEILSEETIYNETGIQFMFFNTVNQLYAESIQNPEALAKADKLLFIPDLINYWLTGKLGNERTMASTSQMLNPRTRNWSDAIIDGLKLPRSIFQEILEPGQSIGKLKESVLAEIGQTELEVIVVGAHDTASAVVGTPFEDNKRAAFLSSGTWSLMGVELPEPVINQASFQASFSNEAGVNGTTRFLKNICGMWLVQQCKETWAKQGDDLSYAQLVKLAEASPSFQSLIDPDAPEFAAPCDMPRKIQEYCLRTCQTVPETKGAIIRLCYESLAAKYKIVSDQLREVSGIQFEMLHVVGGGCLNQMLNQLTSNALNCEVVTGPVEATSMGNIVMQMIGNNELQDLNTARSLIHRSMESITYAPKTSEASSEHVNRLRKLIAS